MILRLAIFAAFVGAALFAPASSAANSPTSEPGSSGALEVGGAGICFTTATTFSCGGSGDYGGQPFDYGAHRLQTPKLRPPSSPAGANSLISLDYDNSCVILRGGLQCWKAGRRAVTVKGLEAGLTDFDFSYWYSHQWCAVRDGGVFCSKSEHPFHSPRFTGGVPQIVFPPGSGATAVVAESSGACALVGGTVYCWAHAGLPSFEKKGFKDGPTPLPGLPSDLTMLDGQCTANSSTVWCFGSYLAGETEAIEAVHLPGVVTDLSGSFDTPCAVVSGGAYCWGRWGFRGFSLDRSLARSSSPRLISGMSSGVTAISSEIDKGCVVRYRDLRCWGDHQSLYALTARRISSRNVFFCNAKREGGAVGVAKLATKQIRFRCSVRGKGSVSLGVRVFKNRDTQKRFRIGRASWNVGKNTVAKTFTFRLPNRAVTMARANKQMRDRVLVDCQTWLSCPTVRTR